MAAPAKRESRSQGLHKTRDYLFFRQERKAPAAPAEAVVSSREADSVTVMKDEKEKGSGKTAALHQKLAAELRALLERKDAVKNYTQGKVTVKDGKTLVQVWLTKSSDEVLKKLKECGLEVSFTATTGKMVIGEIAVDKLLDLAKIQEVRLIEPASVG